MVNTGLTARNGTRTRPIADLVELITEKIGAPALGAMSVLNAKLDLAPCFSLIPTMILSSGLSSHALMQIRQLDCMPAHS